LPRGPRTAAARARIARPRAGVPGRDRPIGRTPGKADSRRAVSATRRRRRRASRAASQPLPDESFAAAIEDADRLAVKLGFRHEPPMPPVEAIAAMVADREHHAFRNALRRQIRSAAVLEVEMSFAVAESLEGRVLAERGVERLAVHGQQPFLDRDDVTADGDDPLDQPPAVARRIEYRDIAALRPVLAEQIDRGQRYPKAVGRLV